jgi:hypothetical protein
MNSVDRSQTDFDSKELVLIELPNGEYGVYGQDTFCFIDHITKGCANRTRIRFIWLGGQ